MRLIALASLTVLVLMLPVDELAARPLQLKASPAVVRQISTDTLIGGGGQHATEVEPDSFAFGSAMVAVFQVGRIRTGGATAIGIAVSRNGGRSWRSGLLPGLTKQSPSPEANDRASDPSVSYDAVHGVWLAASLTIGPAGFQIVISRSSDGVSWTLPMTVVAATAGQLDKEWIACDDWPSSPYRGRCYLAYLDVSSGMLVTRSSQDGGVTWSGPATTSTPIPVGFEANGAQPLPRPDGSLIVVYEVSAERGPSPPGQLLAASSTDGGATFAPPVQVSSLSWSSPRGVRAPPLPSAGAAADGRIFVAWEDCRLDRACRADRILISTSTDGVRWSRPAPAGTATIGSDQFVPALGVDAESTGRSQRIAVTYYSMPIGCAVRPTCRGIDVWLSTSSNGGAHWAPPRRLDATSMRLSWLADAGGRFLGDYSSTCFVAGRPLPVFSLARRPVAGRLQQAIMALVPGSG